VNFHAVASFFAVLFQKIAILEAKILKMGNQKTGLAAKVVNILKILIFSTKDQKMF
jgi:hypothetical protein